MRVGILLLCVIISWTSRTTRCDDFSVQEDPERNVVSIVRHGRILHSIELLTQAERNGFAFDGSKQTKTGFELAVEYSSVIFYHKTFVFRCRKQRFYLSKIVVESFNKHNPEKWTRRVVNAPPNVPLEKFSLTDFMLEGVVKEKR